MKFKIEYARSGRSTCRSCESRKIGSVKIAYGTLRIATVHQSDRFDNIYENWYHIDCLFDGKHDTPNGMEEIKGIQSIRHADQLLIVGKMNETKVDFRNASKRARFNNSCEVDATVMPIIASQNELYYRIYDAMNEKSPWLPERQKKKKLIDFLDLNKQARPTIKRNSTQVFLAHAVDVLAFGAMEVCSKCSHPGYMFDGTYGYVCIQRFYIHDRHSITCDHHARTPLRVQCIIPEEMMNIYPILREHRVPTERVLYKLVQPLNDTVDTFSANAAFGKDIFKYGTVVDPRSGMQDRAHVYAPEYGIVLTRTRSQDNKNSFYKIQLLESDENDNPTYWLFVYFGRIGTEGTHNLTEYSSLEPARQLFISECSRIESYGYEKIDIDYKDEIDAANRLSKKNDIPSTLPESVQRLVEMCFDTRNMEKTMIEFQLDLNRIPLGKLSKLQIDKGYDILMELFDAVNGEGSELEINFLTDRFYTCIPHNIGSERPPLINDLKLIYEKNEMLNSLSEIQLTYSLLSSEDDNGKSTVDNWYEKLKTDIEPLDRPSELFTFLEQYVKRTHSPFHNFELIVEDIFRTTRHGEADRYEPHRNTDNRYLLWHGSRLTNFVGILKNGLKIAPIQAERTGDMFGNGIYFADMVTKSAQYCRIATNDRNDGHGLLLLCEVALGEFEACYKGRPRPASTRSVKGCGKIFPNPLENVVRDGVVIPCGDLFINKCIQSTLIHNEYVVYEECRVKIEYLFRVKFQHKNGNRN